eukprot:8772027-Pyramimonas_sp.AAC.2
MSGYTQRALTARRMPELDLLLDDCPTVPRYSQDSKCEKLDPQTHYVATTLVAEWHQEEGTVTSRVTLCSDYTLHPRAGRRRGPRDPRTAG